MRHNHFYSSMESNLLRILFDCKALLVRSRFWIPRPPSVLGAVTSPPKPQPGEEFPGSSEKINSLPLPMLLSPNSPSKGSSSSYLSSFSSLSSSWEGSRFMDLSVITREHKSLNIFANPISHVCRWMATQSSIMLRALYYLHNALFAAKKQCCQAARTLRMDAEVNTCLTRLLLSKFHGQITTPWLQHCQNMIFQDPNPRHNLVSIPIIWTPAANFKTVTGQ